MTYWETTMTCGRSAKDGTDAHVQIKSNEMIPLDQVESMIYSAPLMMEALSLLLDMPSAHAKNTATEMLQRKEAWEKAQEALAAARGE